MPRSIPFLFSGGVCVSLRTTLVGLKEVLSNDYKVFVIPWDLLKPVYKETERKIWETIKTGSRN